jgi:tetratricopeptide (TPR) repeat protein
MAIFETRIGDAAPAGRTADAPQLGAGVAPKTRWRRTGARSWPLTFIRGRWILLLGLIGLNAYWSWLATRPLTDLAVIERWVDQKRLDEAQHALERRLEYSPNDGDSHALLAQVFRQRNDMLACARELQRIPFWWPTKGKWLIMEAAALKQIDRMREAENAWQAIVRVDPMHPVDKRFVMTAVTELMELFALESRSSEAAKLVWSEYDRGDNAHDQEALLVVRMRTELERIEPAVAAAKLKKFLAADPEDWEARRALAKAEAALVNPAEARGLLETCLSKRPNDHRVWTDYLALLTDLNELDGLRRSIAQIPPSIADDPSFFKFRALLAERDRNWDEAARLYERLTRLRPWERENLYRMALVETRLGRSAQAHEHRQRSEAMRAARVELNDAFQQVLDVRRLDSPSSEVKSAIDRLARVCRALGWTRDADAWERLSPRPS